MTPASDGVLISILIMNIFVSILDLFGSRARGRVIHYSLLFVVIILLGIMLANYIGSNYKSEILQLLVNNIILS